jgi:hypothetical protein
MTGALLLNDVLDAINTYVALPSVEVAHAVTCYIAASHDPQAWEHATRLAIVSPEKRCGKSRLLDVIEATCRDPLIAINISTPALARSIKTGPPTLLLDEADTVFGKKTGDAKEDLRGIINAGHQRNRPYIRWDITTRAIEKCPTFAMAVLAGIGDLPDTIMDRAVVVRMRRRIAEEQVQPYRHRRDRPKLNALGRRLADWAEYHHDTLLAAEPDMPVEDRAADTWEPLVAIADTAGGEWPDRIRNACIRLVAAEEEDAGNTMARALLLDLRRIFRYVQGDLHTATILSRLHKIAESPWSNYYGRLMTANDLSSLLKIYGIKPLTVREVGEVKTLKGYRRNDLVEAWSRYLPPDDPSNDADDDGDGALSYGAW